MGRSLLDWLLPDRNPRATRRWCRLGLHRWEVPGMPCVECGLPDRLWEKR